MKKLTLIIILFTIFFSNINLSNASNQKYNEGYIEKLLDLRVGIEEYDLQLSGIEQISFNDYNTQILFNKYKNSVLTLNEIIIKKYRNKEFNYYQINGIISNQKKFIYHINRVFYYINQKKYYPNNKNLDDAILDNYSVARTYYKRLQRLIYK